MNQKQTRRVAMGGPGYSYKIRKAMAEWLKENGYEYKDFGSHEDGSQPYVKWAREVAEAVASGEFTDGVILCWSGIGPCMIANKVPGVRAALITDAESVVGCRKGNGVNVMASGTKYMNPEKGVELIKLWMNTNYCLPQWTEEIKQIDAIEKEYMKTEKVKDWAKQVEEITRVIE